MVTRTIVAVVLAPLFFVFLFVLPPVYLAVLMSVIVAMASYEFLRATRVEHHHSMYMMVALSAAVIPLGYWKGCGSMVVLIAALMLMTGLFVVSIRLFNEDQGLPFEQILCCLFAGLIVPIFLSSLVRLRVMEQGKFLVLLPIICAFLTDGGAYFVGVFLGKHRGITKVSPNKSLEGYIGGIVFGAVFMVIYGVILQNFAHLTVSFPLMAIYGLLGSAITELGDLAFSLVKRQYGVKDYGNLLPGHGGMMDRFDSMTFAAPMLLILVELFPAF